MKTLALTLALFSGQLLAAVNFTAAEIATHKRVLPQLTSTAANCLENIYDDHLSFHGRWSVSRYYGDSRQDYATRAGRLAALRRYNAPDHLVDQLIPTSCIGLTMKCLAEGFAATGTTPTWNKIYAELAIDRKFDGTTLQMALQGLGWKVLYWNPDPASNQRWDEEDKRLTPLTNGRTWMPVWGGHAYRYSQVKNKGTYYEVKVDDAQMLVGFKDRQPEAFKRFPFFVGTAHAGYHVFPGSDGVIIEAHSMRNLDSIDNLETSLFNPLGMGGGPRWTRTEKYRSGIIAVPPM